MVATHFFGRKHYKNRILKNPIFGEKRWNYFLPVFKAPQKMGVAFFLALSFVFFLFFCFFCI